MTPRPVLAQARSRAAHPLADPTGRGGTRGPAGPGPREAGTRRGPGPRDRHPRPAGRTRPVDPRPDRHPPFAAAAPARGQSLRNRHRHGRIPGHRCGPGRRGGSGLPRGHCGRRGTAGHPAPGHHATAAPHGSVARALRGVGRALHGFGPHRVGPGPDRSRRRRADRRRPVAGRRTIRPTRTSRRAGSPPCGCGTGLGPAGPRTADPGTAAGRRGAAWARSPAVPRYDGRPGPGRQRGPPDPPRRCLRHGRTARYRDRAVPPGAGTRRGPPRRSRRVRHGRSNAENRYGCRAPAGLAGLACLGQAVGAPRLRHLDPGSCCHAAPGPQYGPRQRHARHRRYGIRPVAPTTSLDGSPGHGTRPRRNARRRRHAGSLDGECGRPVPLAWPCSRPRLVPFGHPFILPEDAGTRSVTARGGPQ